MNIYRAAFTSNCPITGDLIFYNLEIYSALMIRAEDIERSFPADDQLHEVLADKFHRLFGGRQVMKATHGRISIETIRGE